MSKSAVLLVALGALALLLVSCGSPKDTLQGEPLDIVIKAPRNVTTPLPQVLPQSQDLCGAAACAKDQVCVKQKCQCLEGFKSCGGSCIPQSSCCADKDCRSTETCVSNKCQFSCSRVICPTNQQCDEAQGRCTCPSDYRFCEVQNKCIPKDFCCDKFDCGRGMLCTQTTNSAQVCLSTKQPFCKYFGDKSSKVLEVGNSTFDVTMAEFFYGKKVKVLVDGKPFVLGNGGQETLDSGITLKVDDIRELGGKCRAIQQDQ